MSYELLTGDCRDVLTGMAADSADAVVTDPPYALTELKYSPGGFRTLFKGRTDDEREARRTKGFMGRDWDNAGAAFDPATWAAVLRVARPGAWLLAAGSPRTYHRLACAVEDGGWVITDCLHHIHSQGFPKGQGQLKPAYEPWTLARKPAARVLPLQINACRLTTGDDLNGGAYSGTLRQRDEYTATDAVPGAVPLSRLNRGAGEYRQPAGRYPPNLLLTHDERCVPSGVRRVKATRASNERTSIPGDIYGGGDGLPSCTTVSGCADPDGYETVADTSGCVEGCPVRRLDEQAGERPSGGTPFARNGTAIGFTRGTRGQTGVPGNHGDTGGASRFYPTFYCSKAPPRERTLPDGTRCPHPTVKPEKLVAWLCSLVSSPGMTILDPFTGSGTTGVCALRMGCRFVGIEQDPEYADYARRRLDAVRPTLDTAREEIHA